MSESSAVMYGCYPVTDSKPDLEENERYYPTDHRLVCPCCGLASNIHHRFEYEITCRIWCTQCGFMATCPIAVSEPLLKILEEKWFK